MNLTEPAVVRKLKSFLLEHLLYDRPVVNLFTDSHPSLTKDKQLHPFQRISITLEDFVVHPDLVGTLGNDRLVLAVEAKGATDLIKGLGQAQCYQDAVHAAFLGAPATAIGKGVLSLAKRKNVGLLAVSDVVELVNLPELHSPLHSNHAAVLRQLECATEVLRSHSFVYNLPTHYLVWTVLLEPGRWFSAQDVPDLLKGYPMPTQWEGALAGARKLGIVERSGDTFALSRTGAALRVMFPQDVAHWTRLHNTVCSKTAKTTLDSEAPEISAALRLLLMHDPIVNLIRCGLESLREQRGSFLDLVKSCDRIDHTQTLVAFFLSESLESILNPDGQIAWDRVVASHFRSNLFYQFKSVLKHAGILAPQALGGASTKGYQPGSDLWILQDRSHPPGSARGN